MHQFLERPFLTLRLGIQILVAFGICDPETPCLQKEISKYL